MSKIIERIISHIVFKMLKHYPKIAERFIKETLHSRYELPVDLTHYYSPVPDIPRIKKLSSRWHKKGTLKGLEFNLDKQKEFVERLNVYKTECDNLPSFSQLMTEGYGEGYGEVEAHFLHCIVRHFRPQKVIEVGSGVSTFFTLNALRINSDEERNHPEVICIEPYPTKKLRELAVSNKIEFHEKEVQDMEIDFFQRLDKNDILFIDSTHVNKIDSDVNMLYLEVLPNLKKGVVIHIHDMPFPYLTLSPEHPLFNYSLLWNEASMVKAFLIFNEVFEVLMCQSYLHFESPETIRRIASIYQKEKHFPSSLWLMKTS